MSKKGSGAIENAYGTWAVAVCRGPVRFLRVWANGKLFWHWEKGSPYSAYIAFYSGTETQEPDAVIEAYQGVGKVPAFRGLAYMRLNGLPLEDFGFSMAINWKFEVERNGVTETYWVGGFTLESTALRDLSQVAWGRINYRPDAAGRLLYESRGTIAAVNASDGSLAWTITRAQMKADAGLSWGYESYFYAVVGCDGRYLIAVDDHIGRLAGYCYDITGAAPVFVGWVWLKKGVTSIPYAYGGQLLNVESEDQSVYIFGRYGLGSWKSGFLVLPPVSQWVGQKVNYRTIKIPNDSEGTNWRRMYPGGMFVLPRTEVGALGASKKYTLYHFLTRGTINAPKNWWNANPGVRDQVAPNFPDGVMLKNPGFPAWEDFDEAGTWTLSLPLQDSGFTKMVGEQEQPIQWPLAPDNANWITERGAGEPAFPFLDVLDDGYDYTAGPQYMERIPHPDDEYVDIYALVWAVVKSGSGGSSNYTQWPVKLRPFIYSSYTSQGYQEGTDPAEGVAMTTAEAGYGNSYDFEFPSGRMSFERRHDTLFVWLHSGNRFRSDGKPGTQGNLYRCQLGELALVGSSPGDRPLLGDVLKRMCVDAGLARDEIDVSEVWDAGTRLTGYTTAEQVTRRQQLSPLLTAYNVDAYEAGGKLRFRVRTGAVDVVIPEEDVGVAPEGQGRPPVLQATRQQAVELPHHVIVEHCDPDREYEQNTQQVKRLGGVVEPEKPQRIGLGKVVLTAKAAKRVAERLLYQAWAGRTSYELWLPPRYLHLEPGDVVETTIRGTTHRILLTQVELGANNLVAVKGMAVEPAVYTPSDAAAAERPVDQDVPVVVPTDIEVIDGPLLSDESDGFGVYVAGAGTASGWRGYTLYASRDEVTWDQVLRRTTAAVMGTAATALPAPATSMLVDRANTVDVTLLVPTEMELATVSEIEMLNGANRAMLGDELIAFTEAELLAEGQYRLKGLLRGLQGTEWAMEQHQAGERFVLLNNLSSGVANLPVPISNAGLTWQLRPVSWGQTVEDVGSEPTTLLGNRLKPLAPVRVLGTRDQDGNLTITWLRRVRVDGELRDYGDAPLDEPEERYEVDILDGGGAVLRTIETTTPEAAYSAADQTSDFGAPQASITVRVYQISNRVGRGHPGEAMV